MSEAPSLARRRAARFGRVVLALTAATIAPLLAMVLFWGFLSRRGLRLDFAWEGLGAIGDFLALQLPYMLTIVMVGVTLWALLGRGRRLPLLLVVALFYVAGVAVHVADSALTWGKIALSPRLLPTLAMNTFGWWGGAAALGGLIFALIMRERGPGRAETAAATER